MPSPNSQSSPIHVQVRAPSTCLEKEDWAIHFQAIPLPVGAPMRDCQAAEGLERGLLQVRLTFLSHFV